MNSETFSEKSFSERWEGTIPECEKIRANIVLDLIGTNKKVLDLGAAGVLGGYITGLIKKAGNDVYAVDASSEYAKDFKDIGVPFTKANLEEAIPFEDGVFDVVFAGEILEHLADTDTFIREIKRVLAKNGSLVLSTPNVVSFGRRLNILIGRNAFFEASFSYPPHAAGHLRYFNHALLREFLKFNGFSVDIYKSDLVNFPLGLYSVNLARVFPTLGRSLIVKARIQE